MRQPPPAFPSAVGLIAIEEISPMWAIGEFMVVQKLPME
jgi:hypothetical protein